MDCRSVEYRTVDTELRAVTRTVPAAFERIPVQMASKMGAGRGAGVEAPLLVPVRRDFRQPLPNDGASARLDFVNRADLARRHILGEILDGRDILADEGGEGTDGLELRSIQLMPQLFALHDHARDDETSDNAMRHALAGVAGVDVDVRVAGIAPAECGVVDRVEHLPRPAMRDTANVRHEITDPGFERLVANLRVVGLAALVVRAANDEIIEMLARVLAHIMIGIERVPEERIG